MYSSDELFQRSREGYCGKNIILFLTRYNDDNNDDKNDDLHTSTPCLTR